ncbi:hypothetical protein Tco_0961204 [Tanacetum coccineum]
MSPTIVLFDVDIGRIYIRHCEMLKSITLNVLARFDDNALDSLEQLVFFVYEQQVNIGGALEKMPPFNINNLRCITGSMMYFFNTRHYLCDSDRLCIDPVSS